MTIQLQHSKITSNKTVTITGSKSESNRLLILKALYPQITIENLSNSDDTEVLQQALVSYKPILDIHHAGTAMRFLTSYFACKQGAEVTLTGSQRMQERPIGLLVDALNYLGADIKYVDKEGFPPLHITGQTIVKNEVTLKANVSSQFISSLMLIAPSLKNGLTINLDGAITSRPYINMTLKLLQDLGIDAEFVGNVIAIKHKSEIPNPNPDNYRDQIPKIVQKPVENQPKKITVESDWSSASYFYSIIALCDLGTSMTLHYYKSDSLQGDSALSEHYLEFGVETRFQNNSILITKIAQHKTKVEFNLNNSPDIAQTIVVTALALGVECDLYGLHTLKIKETNRLQALQNEIEKLGGIVKITEDSLHLEPCLSLHQNIPIDTYNDHRMAMAFAPLALKVPIIIEEAQVVSKSYPTFWEDLKAVGIQIVK